MAIEYKAVEVIGNLCKNNFGIKVRRNQRLILVDNRKWRQPVQLTLLLEI